MTNDTLDTSFLSTESESVTGDERLARLVLRAQEHHQNAIDQLQMVISQTDKGIRLGDGENSMTLEKGTPECNGFRAGLQTAIEVIGSFPIKITDNSSGGE